LHRTIGKYYTLSEKEACPYHLVVGNYVSLGKIALSASSNWGLTESELSTIPPALTRSFSKGESGGFGSRLPGDFGRVLMRRERNSELYGSLQELYEEGREAGSDVWIHKNR